MCRPTDVPRVNVSLIMIIILIIMIIIIKVQIRKRLKRTLFIRTKHDMRIFGVIPFIKLQNNT